MRIHEDGILRESLYKRQILLRPIFQWNGVDIHYFAGVILHVDDEGSERSILVDLESIRAGILTVEGIFGIH